MSAESDALARLPLRRNLRLAYALIAWTNLLIAFDASAQRWASLAVWTFLAVCWIGMAALEHYAIRRDERIVRGESNADA